jgi:hypothetical protein
MGAKVTNSEITESNSKHSIFPMSKAKMNSQNFLINPSDSGRAYTVKADLAMQVSFTSAPDSFYNKQMQTPQRIDGKFDNASTEYDHVRTIRPRYEL